MGTALLVISICAPITSAGKKLKTSSDTATIATSENGSATATCAAGTKAVSGGFETEFDPASPGTVIIVQESARASKREWTASGLNEGDAGDLTSYAYCRKQKLKTASETLAGIMPGVLESVRVACPSGTKAFSGGYESSPVNLAGDTPFMRIVASVKSGNRAWEVTAFNNGNELGELTAYAHCRKGKKLKTAQESASVEPTPGTTFAALEPRCKRKQRVVSGGFSSDYAGSDESAAQIFASRRLGKRTWGVDAFLAINGEPSDVTAYAYCEKNPKK